MQRLAFNPFRLVKPEPSTRRPIQVGKLSTFIVHQDRIIKGIECGKIQHWRRTPTQCPSDPYQQDKYQERC
jgi:hypothetical protein